MKPRLLIALLFAAGSACAAEDAPQGERPAQKGGVHELSDADLFLRRVDSVREQGAVKSISIIEFLRSGSTLRTELVQQFKKDHPRLLKEALESAGNMHNPKVRRLRAVFHGALLRTSTMKKMEEGLNRRGLTIAGVASEKFYFDKAGDPASVQAMVWLSLRVK